MVPPLPLYFTLFLKLLCSQVQNTITRMGIHEDLYIWLVCSHKDVMPPGSMTLGGQKQKWRKAADKSKGRRVYLKIYYGVLGKIRKSGSGGV